MQMNAELRTAIENQADEYVMHLCQATTDTSGREVVPGGFVIAADVEQVHLGGDGWNEPREYGFVGHVSILTPDEEYEIATGEIVPEDGLMDLDWESDKEINRLLAV